jgi:GDP-mannose 6-dehydrogenase
LGYVGAVTAACFAKLGNKVLGVDVNPAKVSTIEAGKSPILEPQIDEIIAQSRSACRLHATTDAHRAILETAISFVSVGTPSQRNGKLDLRGLEHVCGEIGQALKHKADFHSIVIRSTVLPGTTRSVAVPSLEAASGKKAGRDFAVCFIPEFLREGSAVADFFDPPFTILGSEDSRVLEPLRQLFAWAPTPIFETSMETAEMIKYMCNAFHALKVGFVNEIGALCKELNVDSESVAEIFATDTRLNVSKAYLKPGFAFGGSCLPKDLRALNYRAKELDLHLPLLESLMPSNNEHIERAVEMVLGTGKRKVAMLGLSFKANTDDLRESPFVHLAKRLIGEGCQIRVWDRNVSIGRLIGSNRQFIEDYIPHIGSLLYENLEEALEGAEVVLVGSKAPSMMELGALLKPGQAIVDLVNLEKERRYQGPAAYTGICW